MEHLVYRSLTGQSCSPFRGQEEGRQEQMHIIFFSSFQLGHQLYLLNLCSWGLLPELWQVLLFYHRRVLWSFSCVCTSRWLHWSAASWNRLQGPKVCGQPLYCLYLVLTSTCSSNCSAFCSSSVSWSQPDPCLQVRRCKVFKYVTPKRKSLTLGCGLLALSWRAAEWKRSPAPRLLYAVPDVLPAG